MLRPIEDGAADPKKKLKAKRMNKKGSRRKQTGRCTLTREPADVIWTTSIL
jgi:hypothetical protein